MSVKQKKKQTPSSSKMKKDEVVWGWTTLRGSLTHSSQYKWERSGVAWDKREHRDAESNGTSHSMTIHVTTLKKN